MPNITNAQLKINIQYLIGRIRANNVKIPKRTMTIPILELLHLRFGFLHGLGQQC